MKKICKVKFRGLCSLLLLFLLSISSFQASAQTKTISGTVKDSDGLGLPGVNIIVKGTTIGTVSDFDGNYTLVINDATDAILVFSFIGFESQEVKLGNQAKVSVIMKTDAELLEDVVVVGFGRQKKETVVGSITQAKGEELLQAGSVTTVSEALTGILPGVSTMQAAGQPGSTAANILIRGQSTWSNNQPLYVVDGVERDFNDLDPNEIESISVLKDASATAVYGVKAANGVILVTTKRGTKGKAKVSFSSSWGLKDPTIDTDYFADYVTTMEHYNIAALNDGLYDNLIPESYINAWRDPNRDKDRYTYTTWINELLKTGYNSQYNLNVRGGNDFVKYFTSFGYQYDGDIYDIKKQPDFDPRTYQRKYTWRTNLDFSFSKTTKASVNLAGNFRHWNGNRITANTNDGIAAGNGDVFTRTWQTPLVGPAPVLSDGRLGIVSSWVVHPNFIGEMEREGQYNRRFNTIYSDFILEQNLTKYLKVKGKVSYNIGQSYESRMTKNVIYYYPNDDGGWTQYGDPEAIETPLQFDDEDINGSNNSLYYELALDYAQRFGNHNVSALALFNRRRAQNNVAFPRYEESWVGRVTYDFKTKYLVEFNGAYNGNENWAPGLRFGFFPSVALGWTISEESFVKDKMPFIEYLKVRYSYGEIGSDAGIGNNRFLYQSVYTEGPTNTAGGIWYGFPNLYQYAPVVVEGIPAVPENTWETAIKQDIGVEFSVLGDKLNGTVEFFDEKREGILMQRRTVPPWFGNASPFANIGKTKNHGIDIELKWQQKIGRDFGYHLRGNISMSENRVVNRDDPPTTPDYQLLAGKPIGYSSGLLNDGIHQSWDEVYNSPFSTFNGNIIPGNLSFVDFNADGQITDQDRVPIQNPSYATKTFAFNFGLSYKNFSVNALFNGMWDVSKYLSNLYLFEYTSASSHQYTGGWQLLNNEQRNYWSPQNPEAQHPGLSLINKNHDTQTSEYNIRSSTFLRLKTVEVKYRIGKALKQRIGLFDSLEVYVNGNNLYTWSELPKEIDPEQRRLEVYPLTKRYNFGIRASF